jgi:hypothetical protein
MKSQEIITSTQLSPTTRALLLSVWDGEGQALPHLYLMANLVWCDEALGWLVRNNLTGKKFVHWLKFEHDGSLLGAMSHIRMKLNRDLEPKPLFHGKDLR